MDLFLGGLAFLDPCFSCLNDVAILTSFVGAAVLRILVDTRELVMLASARHKKEETINIGFAIAPAVAV